MTTWGTTSYDTDGVESHRDLSAGELPLAVYAVEASDDGGRSYASNGLRWTNPDDARRWGGRLAMRWFGCTHIRVVLVTAPEVESLLGYTVVDVITQVL